MVGQELESQVGTTSDSRKIVIPDYTTGKVLKDFNDASLSAAEKLWFQDKCSSMTQCITFDSTQVATANSAKNMINFLRGRSEREALVYRDRAFGSCPGQGHG